MESFFDLKLSNSCWFAIRKSSNSFWNWFLMESSCATAWNDDANSRAIVIKWRVPMFIVFFMTCVFRQRSNNWFVFTQRCGDATFGLFSRSDAATQRLVCFLTAARRRNGFSYMLFLYSALNSTLLFDCEKSFVR